MPDDDTNGRGPSGGERDGKVDEIRAADANAPGEKPEDAKRGRRSNARDRLLEARKITGPVDATLFTLPPGFARHNDGYWRQPGEGKTPFRVCGLFGVVAETRPEDGNEWGLLLDWEDRDGTLHEWIMPRRLLVGEAVEVRARLAAGGLFVGASDGARRALVELLANVAVPALVRIVPQ